MRRDARQPDTLWTAGRPPRFAPGEALRLARELYGIAGRARPLPSERDRNVLIESESGDAFVLKISEAGEDRLALEAQNAALARLAAAGLPYRFPRVVRSRAGEEIVGVEGRDGQRHWVRLLTYVPGVPLARVRPRTDALLRAWGRLLGDVDAALAGFAHPGAEREFVWDVRHGPRVVRAHLDAIEDPQRRARLERAVELFETHAGPRLDGLRAAVIYGDGNDHNVLVEPLRPDADPFAPRAVVGLVDFGDLVRSVMAAEVAVACAYAMMGTRDPLRAAAQVVAGYHEARRLNEDEIAVLYPLAVVRLAMSVVVMARRRQVAPENDYLGVHTEAAWDLLERVNGVHPRFAECVFRDACGLPPSPGTAHVVAWLAGNADRLGPVLDPDPRSVRRVVLDLSVGSPETADPRGWAVAVAERMRDAGAELGIGRYAEVRAARLDDPAARPRDEAPDAPTVHLGIDLFAAAGTRVLAPLDGRVVRADRGAGGAGGTADAGDREPECTLRLEHAPEPGLRFYTEYAHLEAGAADVWRPGRHVRRGDELGRVAAARDPRGVPHVHLQLLAEVPTRDGRAPHRARPSERAVWRALAPDPSPLLRCPEPYAAEPGPDARALLERRRRRLGRNLSVSYRRPLRVVRGWMQFLFDDAGQPFLDAVNNVAHVGHEHPRVVAALRRQAAVLNTNTRYLYDALVEYADRLAAGLPDPLRVVYVVNSGSEANELALRLARAHTGRRDVVVIDGAYHGNTTGCVEISPYKFNGPGGTGAPPHVHVVPTPDPYRGLYRGRGREVGARYAEHVREAVARARARGGVAAFVCEPLLSCAGQIVPPEGYLEEAFRVVREAGGVCIADEVQVGFGRVGTHMWAFETQGVVPDIVTMGKPIGNGHPLGAVVTTPEIAASFDNGMEYFNTFGGNPVSCAVGLAVLDVLEEERLQEHALRVGTVLAARLRALADRHTLVGDVRGLGLFLGVELVTDRAARTPATREAAYVVERARDFGVLLSVDGPDRNVIKIKPPLPFDEADAARLVAVLDRVLGEDPVRNDDAAGPASGPAASVRGRGRAAPTGSSR